MCFIQVCIKEVWLYERKAHRDPSKTTMMCLFITHKLSFSTVWMCSAKDCRFLCVWRIYITIQHKMEVTVFQKRKTGIGNYSLHFLFMFPSQCGYLKHKTYKAHDMFDISEQQCYTAWHVPSLSWTWTLYSSLWEGPTHQFCNSSDNRIHVHGHEYTNLFMTV